MIDCITVRRFHGFERCNAGDCAPFPARQREEKIETHDTMCIRQLCYQQLGHTENRMVSYESE